MVKGPNHKFYSKNVRLFPRIYGMKDQIELNEKRWFLRLKQKKNFIEPKS